MYALDWPFNHDAGGAPPATTAAAATPAHAAAATGEAPGPAGKGSEAKPQPWRPQRPVAPFDTEGGTAHVGAFKAEAGRRAAAAAARKAWSLEDAREDGCVGLGGWLQ